MTKLFDENNTGTNPEGNENDQDGFLSKYVGEGKKYASEEDLAKAYDHAVAHIQKVENEQRELRQDLEQRTTLEEFVQKLRPQEQEGTTNVTPSGTPPAGEGNGTEVVKSLSADEIKALAQEEFNRSREAEQRERNAQHVQAQLVKDLGGDYNVHVMRRLSELGLSTDQAQNMAETNPKVFLELIGKRNFGQPGDGAPPQGLAGRQGTPGTSISTRTSLTRVPANCRAARTWHTDIKGQRQPCFSD